MKSLGFCNSWPCGEKEDSHRKNRCKSMFCSVDFKLSSVLDHSISSLVQADASIAHYIPISQLSFCNVSKRVLAYKKRIRYVVSMLYDAMKHNTSCAKTEYPV
jgi:hypothetical protein